MKEHYITNNFKFLKIKKNIQDLLKCYLKKVVFEVCK